MFYYASKILWFFLTPSNLIFAILFLGFILVLRKRESASKTGKRMLAFGMLALLLCGLGPVSTILNVPLEKRFKSRHADPLTPPTGIIVLGGAVKSRSPLSSLDMIETNEAGERMTAMLMLANVYPEAKIVFTGGVGDVLDRGIAEADEVKLHVARLGLSPDRMIFENRSRNTVENAVFTRDLVKPKTGERWLLVTSAWHMPRSVGCFRQAGFPVEAYPVDFRSNGWADLRRPFGSIAAGLRTTDTAFREWLGLIAYRLTGKTDALLPGG